MHYPPRKCHAQPAGVREALVETARATLPKLKAA
jgi:hypothetical protein